LFPALLGATLFLPQATRCNLPFIFIRLKWVKNFVNFALAEEYFAN
jgi:hypothetical protein